MVYTWTSHSSEDLAFEGFGSLTPSQFSFTDKRTFKNGRLFIWFENSYLLHGFESFVALCCIIFYYGLMIHSIIGVTAGVLAFVAFIPYIASIIKGKTKPQRTTFAIWSAISLVTLFSYFATGARETIWVALVYAVLQISVFALSFKYGMGGFGKLDITCLSGAFIGIIFWIVTDNPAIALYVSIAAELLGWIPLLKKTYSQPETENTLSWVIGAIAACLNLFALTTLRFDIALYPIYVVISEGLVALLLIFPKLRYHAKES
jgi:hypothetical protein